MADEPNPGEGDSGAPDSATPPRGETITLNDLITRILNPRLDADERLRRTISGDVDSLAWWTADAPTSPAQAVRDLITKLNDTWNADGPPIGPRLEAQLWGIHNDLANPDGGLNRVVYDRLSALGTVFSDPENPAHADLLKRLDAIAAATDPNSKDLRPDDLPPALLGDTQQQDNPSPWDKWLHQWFPNITAITDFMFSPKLASSRTAVAAHTAGVAIDSVSNSTNWRFLSLLEPIVKERMTGESQDALADAIGSKFLPLFQKLLEVQSASLAAVPGDSPDAARQRAAVAIGEAMSFGLAAHGTAVALELLHPLKNMGLAQVAGLLADMAGFQPISNALWGHLVGEAVDTPLRYGYAAQFRQRIPPQGEIFAAARKYEFETYEEFDRQLATQGIRPDWARLMYRYMWADPRLGDIVRMADISVDIPDPSESDLADLAHYQVDPSDRDWWLTLKFKKAGYDHVDIPVLTNVVKARMNATYITRQRTQLRDMFSQGIWTEDEFREAMRQAGTQPAAIDIDVATVLLERQQAAVKETLAEVDKRFKAGAISEDDVRLAYSAQLHDAGVVELNLTRLQTQQQVQVAQAEASDAKSAIRKTQTALVNAYTEQFKRNLLTQDELVAALIQAGLTPEWADATAQLAAVRKIPVPKVAAKSDEQLAAEKAAPILQDAYVSQYRAGALNEDQLHAALQQAGYADAVATAVVLRELGRKALAAKQDADAAAAAAQKAKDAAAKADAAAKQRAADAAQTQLQNQFIAYLNAALDKGVVSDQDAITRLERAGLTHERAILIVGTAAAKKGRDSSFVTDPPLPHP